MEYTDGGNLDEIIRERRQENNYFSEEEILEYFTQICLALKHCHDRNILHRNINSYNIFMTRSGLCKLGGFSVATALIDTRENKVKAVTLVGTPFFISPEMYEG